MDNMQAHARPGRKQLIAIAVLLALGAAAAVAILGSGRHEAADGDGHDHGQTEEAADDRGPHGGRLLRDGDLAIEATIFEKGVEPQWRLYAYRDGKPAELAPGQVSLLLERLGRAPQTFRFTQEAGYLKGDAVVEEPHSFKATVQVADGGRTRSLGWEQAEARVAMSDAQLHAAGVEIATAGPAAIASTIELPAEVRYNADRTVRLVARLGARVEEVKVAAGDRVRKGQVLAVLSSQAVAGLRAELLAAQRRHELARATWERERRLWEAKVSPEQDVQQARHAMQEAEIAVRSARQKLEALGASAASSQLARLELLSPMAGIVTERPASAGQSVGEDTPLLTVSDLSSVWVEAAVPPADLGTVLPGRRVQVRANAFEAQADGSVQYLSPLVGEQSRSATARVLLPNPKGVWRPGLPVTLTVVAAEQQVAVAVAVQAVQDLRDWKVVFGRYGEQFEARPLKLGRSDGRMVEVLEGLQAGERYAARNSYVVKADIGKAGASHDH